MTKSGILLLKNSLIEKLKVRVAKKLFNMMQPFGNIWRNKYGRVWTDSKITARD